MSTATLKKRAERAPGHVERQDLSVPRHLFEATFRSQRDGILILDNARRPRILSANPAALRMFGYTRDELCGMAIDRLLNQSGKSPFTPALRRTIAEYGFCDLSDSAMRRADGSHFPTEYSITPLYDDRHIHTGWILVVRDVSSRKHQADVLRDTTEKLRHERELLTSKNSALREVIAQVDQEKHHLRSQIQSNVEKVIHPILGILRSHVSEVGAGYLDMLETHLNDLVSPFIRRLDQAADRLSPRETEICTLICQGMTSKEIADCLGISDHTVLKLRQRIRRKLNLTNEDVNLVRYLQNLRSES